MLYLLLYVLPGMLNFLLFREDFEEVMDVPDAYYAYAIICFMPVVNLLAFLFYIITYVCKIFRQD
jgi:hypothetical protein